ncbi:hypothetical protein [Segeticoccus rhizosphaerae]|uniref:hypothetical protein n=1 Tax=Segeticoccus rhizosphaerae TaxID=1104777 RepID=UPI0012658048|nr:hypothetical protein [Segeticoccus rhizosphaerae]
MTHTTTHTTDPATAATATPPVQSPTPASAMTTHGLEWLGPIAFTRRHAGRGVDRDFGDHWGRLGDQRLTVRHQLGADHGLLYVYDPTWREYAALADDVPLDAVHDATARAAARDPHTPVSQIVAALLTEAGPAQARSAMPEPVPQVEL